MKTIALVLILSLLTSCTTQISGYRISLLQSPKMGQNPMTQYAKQTGMETSISETEQDNPNEKTEQKPGFLKKAAAGLAMVLIMGVILIASGYSGHGLLGYEYDYDPYLDELRVRPGHIWDYDYDDWDCCYDYRYHYE